MKPLLVYLLIINASGLLLMLTDKHNAIEKLRRIPEAALMAVAIAGGSLGCLLGMRLFHHKTRKPLFARGVPLIFVAHLISYFLFFR